MNLIVSMVPTDGSTVPKVYKDVSVVFQCHFRNPQDNFRI